MIISFQFFFKVMTIVWIGTLAFTANIATKENGMKEFREKNENIYIFVMKYALIISTIQ